MICKCHWVMRARFFCSICDQVLPCCKRCEFEEEATEKHKKSEHYSIEII